MRRDVVRSILGVVLLASMWAPGLSVAAETPTPAQDTLYKRLGGYDAIAAVVDDFIGRLAGDAKLKRFFGGHSESSLKKLRQLLVDQLCAATGGPCLYLGRSMEEVHKGLNITEEDWEITAKHLVATLEKFNVPAREKNEVVAAISSMKNQIVGK